MTYFDQPRPRPVYRGVSDPVERGNQPNIARARTQAIHRAYLEWATSEDREHWVPDALTLQVVAAAPPELFTRNKIAITARLVADSVLPLNADQVAEVEKR